MKSSLAAAVVALLVATTAFAGDPTKEDLARADALYEEGKAALEAGRIDEACPKLAESLAIDRAAGTLLNLARCHQLQGKTATAWTEYTEAAKVAEAAGQVERAKGARELADKLLPTVSKLKIEIKTRAPGLVVKRDDLEIGEVELGKAVLTDPGTYTITASAPGFETFTTKVEVSAQADAKTVAIDLKKTVAAIAPKVETDSGPSPLLIAGIVTGGVGVVGIGLGAVFGIMTMGDLDDAETDPSLCPAMRCTPAGRETVDGAETKGIVSTIGFAVGGAALATGVVLVILDVTGSPASAETGWRLGPGPGDGGASVAWAF